jgi:hypothetical protein
MSNEENKQRTEEPAPLGSVLLDLGQRLIPRLQAFQRSLRAFAVTAEPYLRNFLENVKTVPSRISAVQRILARRGWFIPPEVPAMTFLNLVEEYSTAGQMKELDQLMTKYIDSRLDELEANLIAGYPHRAALFEEAFKAHRQGMYASSVTILLSQADGVCIDSFGQRFFSMETVKGGVKQPKTKRIIQAQGASMLQEMMLEPLLSGSGMGAGEKEQAAYSDSPNRHTVMHGIDTKYPSKMNSAKAISLVAYLGITARKTIEDLNVGSTTLSITTKSNDISP